MLKRREEEMARRIPGYGLENLYSPGPRPGPSPVPGPSPSPGSSPGPEEPKSVIEEQK